MILVAAFTHWWPRLLPVAALLYLLVVFATALLCGSWQAVIVSLSAVVAQSWFTARESELAIAADPITSFTLLVFVLLRSSLADCQRE